MLRQSRAQAWGMAVKTLLIMTTALTWLWLLLVSQRFHFILSEAPEEAPLPFPLGSTPSWHVSPWGGRGAEPFPFGGTRTKTGSDDSARGFCRKEVCLVRTTSIDTKIVVKRK